MRVVIIGAGPAGLTVAETLRQQGCQAEIVMFSAEPFPPYAPPAILDYLLSGKEESLFWKGRQICQKLGADYRAGVRVKSVRPQAREVSTADGTTVSYDRLVIASGSHLYAPVRGYGLAGVYDFKSLSAARALVEQVRQGRAERAVVVGAGFIGVEVALLLRRLGLVVTVVEMQDRVMPRMLEAETAAIALEAMEERGIVVRLNCKVLAFAGETAVRAVELESGEALEADIYVAATGVKPNTACLEGSGVEVGWGVRVDNYLRTNFPEVYAAGDVAETRDRLSGERYVHAIFPNAVAQARVVAQNILGAEIRYDGAENMNSLKHLGLPIVAVGEMRGEQELRWQRGRILRKIFLRDGCIVGFRLAGDIRGAGIYRSLMLRRQQVGHFGARLARPGFGMAEQFFFTT